MCSSIQGLLKSNRQTVKSCHFKQNLNVNSNVVAHTHIVKGQPQRKGASPVFVHYQILKYVKDISCVDKNPQRRLHSLLEQAKSDKVTDHHKLPDRGIICTYYQKCSRTGHKLEISWIFQLTIFGPKTKQPVETSAI